MSDSRNRRTMGDNNPHPKKLSTKDDSKILSNRAQGTMDQNNNNSNNNNNQLDNSLITNTNNITPLVILISSSCVLTKLPKDIINEIFEYLSVADLYSFRLAMVPLKNEKSSVTERGLDKTELYSLFKNTNKHIKKTQELAAAVLDADEEKIQKILEQVKKTPELKHIITMRVKNIKEELCGRTWGKDKDAPGVSALELSAWIGDWTITEKLLACVPPKDKQEALNQLKGVKNNGLEYGDMMAPLLSLIQGYKNAKNLKFTNLKQLSIQNTNGMHKDRFNDYCQDMNVPECNLYCIKKIGTLQKQATKFVLQWLCDEKSSTYDIEDRAPTRTCIGIGLPENVSIFNKVVVDFNQLGNAFFIIKFSNQEALLWYQHSSKRPDPGAEHFLLNTLYEKSCVKLNLQIAALQKEVDEEKKLSLQTKNSQQKK